ncbi:MAG TPA: SGNH/GDSL hydrolase family protein [archaeon]|nr:SGNH/GDSL hydrolase family protein [archaeon]
MRLSFSSSGTQCQVLVFLLVLSGISQSAGIEKLDPGLARVDSSIAWYDVRDLGVEGKGWSDTEDYYDRLPVRARQIVRDEVWSLSKNSSGLCVRFLTDAVRIAAAWDGGGGMPHMAATGVSGVDLYVKKDGKWRFLRVGKPDQERTARMLHDNLPGEPAEYLLYLPLYNRVTKVEIGIPPEAMIARVPSPAGKPVVFYGTSITQGGCASRPGMAYPAILGRWLDRVTINLGFSGNGRMEPEVAGFLAELDPAVYVIDCIPNVSEKIGELTGPLVKIIRQKHPETYILLVEDVRPGDAEANNQLDLAYRRLLAEGDRNVFLLQGEGMIGDDLEATVDTRHPTDLGFIRMAEGFKGALSVLLKPADR